MNTLALAQVTRYAPLRLRRSTEIRYRNMMGAPREEGGIKDS